MSEKEVGRGRGKRETGREGKREEGKRRRGSTKESEYRKERGTLLPLFSLSLSLPPLPLFLLPLFFLALSSHLLLLLFFLQKESTEEGRHGGERAFTWISLIPSLL